MTSISAIGDPADMGAMPVLSKADRKRAIDELKRRDNTTNFYYIAQVYAVLIATVALTIWSYNLVAEAGLAWWWNTPVTIIAIVVMGATQHQFGGIVHEGTHHILFKDRIQNELVSDWLAAFPIFTSTYSFRLHHLAHHQFVNDPTRDPNFEMAHSGGYWLDFPVEHIELLAGIARMLWFPNLFRYIMARFKQSSISAENNPYIERVRSESSWPARIGIAHVVLTPFLILPFQIEKMYLATALVLVAATGASVLYSLLAPDSAFQKSRLNPTVSHRTTQINRTLFTGLLYSFLVAMEYATGHPTWLYFLLLWILPLFTTFPTFMILREWLQHGNADRGRYTNSRVMLFSRPLQYAVMPWGMDYHLPHHIVAVVPHYNIRKLHDFLVSTDQKYADHVQVVKGWTPGADAPHPGIVDVLGPKYAPTSGEVHIASEVLQYSDVNDPDGIDNEEAESRSDG